MKTLFPILLASLFVAVPVSAEDSTADKNTDEKAAEKAPAKATKKTYSDDRLELDTSTIRGNQELPKVLYIVPWKDAALGELDGMPTNRLVDEVLAPVDRDVFRRQETYFHQLYDE